VGQTRLGDLRVEHAKQFLRLQQIRTVSLDEVLADTAADADRRYGKGRHPAQLNLGDCFLRLGEPGASSAVVQRR
jgi:ribonuclease VapC